jgi:multiple sugar transport system ATP-binding protein
MVFQSYALYPHMSVAQNMSFGLQLAKVRKQETLAKVGEVARTLQLEVLLDRKPRDLSGGQRQRVAIGCMLLREPRVFLFDEPLSNLDASLRVHMRIEIARLHQRLGATMVYVTHDQIEAMTLADKIVVLNAGRIEQIGAPLELYHYPRNQFVAGFIGSPQMNFLSVKVVAVADAALEVRVPNAGVMRLAVDSEYVSVGQTVTLGVRPEHIVEASAADCVIRGTVGVAERLGDHTLVYLTMPQVKGWVLLRASGDQPVAIGDMYSAGLAANRCHVFREDGSACQRRHREPALYGATA